MSEATKFTPVRGSQADIFAQGYHEGYLYFATDTKQIYMDANGHSKIPMGGGSSTGAGIIFADRPILPDEEELTTISFTLSQLNIDYLPSVDSVILNTSDGCFYRVTLINSANDIETTRLTVAGGGGGNTPVVERDVFLDIDASTIYQGATYIAGQSYNAIFTPSTQAEGDTTCSLTFEIIDNEHDTSTIITKTNLPNNKPYKFDMAQLPLSNNITMVVTVNSANSQYNRGLGYSRNIVQLKVVSMSITKPSIDSYLPLVKADDLSGTLNLKYMPNGDESLTLKIHVYIDDVEDLSKQEVLPTSYYNRVVSVSIPRQTHGVHNIKLVLSTELNGITVYSNSIDYQGAWASSDDDTPIIWVGEYDKTIINYENSYVYFMVYDPINYRNGLPAEIHLYKDNSEVSQIDANYSDDGWLIWDISNLYEVGDNNFAINCRTVTSNLAINVTTEGSRDLGLESPSSLLLNITTAGRSSSEIKSQRTVLKSLVNPDSIDIRLNDFNWQNNGWKDSEGPGEMGVDSGSFLSIANGASMSIQMAGNGLALNQSKDYTFEFRFRVKNVQEYSTLIRTIPKYFYMVPNEESEDGWQATYNIDSNGTVSGPSLLESEIKDNGYKIGVDEYGNLLMDEENTIKQEDTSSGVIVRWLSDSGYGFCIGTQEAYFKTPSGIANVRYCEDKVINLSMVASKSDNLCYIYLNGILSGAIAMPTGAGSSFTINSPFEFNSQYCDLDLYRFRVYELGLTVPQVIHNYLSDMHSITLYDQNQLTDPLDDYALSYELVANYNKKNPTAPTMPYMTWKITDGTDELLPWKKGNARKVNVEFINAPLDAALDAGEIDEWFYYTHSPSFVAEGADIDVQGTSSQKYPRRNYKIKYKAAKKTWKFTKGSLKGKSLADDQVVIDRDGNEHELCSKFHMDLENVGINKFTMKIDYMESSESYNTGFANLMGNIVHPLYTKHPMKDLNLGIDTDELRTSVYGYPLMVFHGYNDGTYEYIGKYNMNSDKGANEAYGYENKTEQPYVGKRIKKVLNEETNEYEDVEYQPTIAEIAECWELKDNQGTWCSFRYPDAASRASGFGTLQEGTTGDSAKLELLNHYEYRYSYYGDQLDSAYEYSAFVDPDTQIEYTNNGQINNYLRDKHHNLEVLFNWLDSTDVNNATNEDLNEPITYSVASQVYDDDSITYEVISDGLWSATFTKDTKEYRRQKFRSELSLHLDKEYCLTYFVMTELLLCYDSRGKNLMLATWGPHRAGGDYIWYPTFYDIDTQLGLNNSGAYLWDYDADVTQDNLFSTPTSVLWNNLYDLFYDDIVQKYRVLRGVANAPTGSEDINGSLTYQNIAGSYECNAQVFNSYAMKGVRPIVAVGLDEYYKYLAPALKKSDFDLGKKYAGYYDTTGTHLYQSTPTYMYACQGDKKLTTELLLRNRLNYLDSWWLGGDYRAGVVENQIFIRANANHSSTSDLFLDSASLDEIPSTAAGKGFTLEPYPKAAFDARPGAKIKPFLHQYVSYFMDSQPSVPVKYTGGTDQEDGVWTNVDSAKLIAFKTEPDLSQQITYIPGGDYISSLGDLSLMYPNSLQIFHGQRLLDFKLGSDIPGYKNPLITSASDWELAPMPLLQSVNISKLNQFNRELDLTGSAKLKEFRALGSIIERINFASGAPLHTVHLPKTITTVSLVQHEDLDTILTEAPVVVELNDSGEYEYVDSSTYRGLYIEDVTDYNPANAGKGHKLLTYEVAGGGLGYHSYTILKNLYDLKFGATNNQYLRASLTDVKWTPYEKIEIGTSYDASETYYLLNDHSSFEPFVFISADDWNNKLLNELIFVYNEEFDGTEELTITDLSLLDDLIANYETARAAGVESQFGNTSGSTQATIPTITGTLYVSNDNSHKIVESELTSKYKVYFPNLTIHAKYIQNANLTKYIRVYESGKVENLDTERTSGTSPLMPTISAPTQTYYDFVGWSTDNPNTTTNPTLALEYHSATQTYTTTPAWDALVFNSDISVITFYAIFEIHKYSITFMDGNSTVLEVVKVPAGDYVSTPNRIPYNPNESSLDLQYTYSFVGYSRLPNGEKSDIIATRPDDINKLSMTAGFDITLYPVFEEVDVYKNIHPEYFTAQERNYSDVGYVPSVNIVNENGYILSLAVPVTGKLTIPATFTKDGETKPVIGLNTRSFNANTNGNSLTHIFFEKNATGNSNIRFLPDATNSADGVFANTSIQYFEFTDSLRYIGSNAFFGCALLTNTSIGTNVIAIGTSAFNGAFSSAVSTLNVPGSVVKFGDNAIAYNRGYGVWSNVCVFSNVYIGSETQPSNIDIAQCGTPFFRQVGNTNLTIYANAALTDAIAAKVADAGKVTITVI